MRGALFETFVLSEIQKRYFNRGLQSRLYFWRDRSGNEVDVLLERSQNLQPVELKSGQTLNPDYFKGLHRWLELAGSTAIDPTLVYGGDQSLTHLGIRAVPWHNFAWLEIPCSR